MHLHRPFTQAAELRAALGLLPSDPATRAVAVAADAAAAAQPGGAAHGGRATTVFRLVNSEGDALSGVVADMLGDVVVVQVGAWWGTRGGGQEERVAAVSSISRRKPSQCGNSRPSCDPASPSPQSCAAWSERFRGAVTSAISRHAGAARVVWRQATSILIEEGVDVAAADGAATSVAAPPAIVAEYEGAPDGESWEEAGGAGGSDDEDEEEEEAGAGGGGGAAAADGAVAVVERGVVFLASPEKGQKTGEAAAGAGWWAAADHVDRLQARPAQKPPGPTPQPPSHPTPLDPHPAPPCRVTPGFYADQRDNRAFIAGLSKGKAVLDLCCYSGGFALTAAAAGAASAIGERRRGAGAGNKSPCSSHGHVERRRTSAHPSPTTPAPRRRRRRLFGPRRRARGRQRGRQRAGRARAVL
jgi:hypothetical protein